MESLKWTGLWLIEGWRLSGGSGEHSDLHTKTWVDTPGLFWEQTSPAHTHSHRSGMWVCPGVNAVFNPSPGHPLHLLCATRADSTESQEFSWRFFSHSLAEAQNTIMAHSLLLSSLRSFSLSITITFTHWSVLLIAYSLGMWYRQVWLMHVF